jgi:hypothetical protein
MIGALILGAAVGSAIAQPVQPPPVPVPVSPPRVELPAWTTAGVPKRAPVVVEEAPPPRPKVSIEVAPPARPVQSADPARPAPIAQPGFNLRPPEPRLTFNPSGPPAPPAIGLLPPPNFADPGGFAVPTPAPGDTPMPVLPTRQLVLSAVFGAALAAPVAAQDKEGGKTAPPDLAAIKTQLDQIQKDVKSLQEFRKNTDDAVYGKENSTALADMGLIRRLTEIESQISKINEALKQINAKLGEAGKSTTAAFGPTLPGTMAGRGFVRIVNDYPTEMSMIVNGRSHRVPPGQTVTVDVPAGRFTYELLHAGASPTATTVKDGETMTLRIR